MGGGLPQIHDPICVSTEQHEADMQIGSQTLALKILEARGYL